MSGGGASLYDRLDRDACLRPTAFIDSDAGVIVAWAEQLGLAALDPRARAARAFEAARDEIQYEFLAKLDPASYRASHVRSVGRGFCVQKAIALCALLRASAIPAALVFCDMADRSLSPRITSALRTEVMFHHGLVAVEVEGCWRLVDPSASPDLVTRKRYRPVVFDGERDALMASTTLDGRPHAEYLRFHGAYSDLPFDQMVRAFEAAYAGADVVALERSGART